MTDFDGILVTVNEKLYVPAGWNLEAVSPESQNAEYGAGVFRLRGAANTTVSVRFRAAKTTPTKIGQFVVFWEKDAANQNQAFAYEKAPDLLVVHVFHPITGESGQFIFPKDVLLKHGVWSTDKAKGKMAMRVYPDWDEPASKQAIATQKWQRPYFAKVDLLNDAQPFEEDWRQLHIGLS